MVEEIPVVSDHIAIREGSREVQEEISACYWCFVSHGPDFTVIGAKQTQAKYVTHFLRQTTVSFVVGSATRIYFLILNYFSLF